jgi:hypothetical protein
MTHKQDHPRHRNDEHEEAIPGQARDARGRFVDSTWESAASSEISEEIRDLTEALENPEIILVVAEAPESAPVVLEAFVTEAPATHKAPKPVISHPPNSMDRADQAMAAADAAARAAEQSVANAGISYREETQSAEEEDGSAQER